MRPYNEGEQKLYASLGYVEPVELIEAETPAVLNLS